jgi:hypothetical protein
MTIYVYDVERCTGNTTAMKTSFLGWEEEEWREITRW